MGEAKSVNDIATEARKGYCEYGNMTRRLLPSRSDRLSEILSRLEEAILYARWAESDRRAFEGECRKHGWICDCRRRRHMSTWELDNKHRMVAECDSSVYHYPLTPCPNCGKLLPGFDE